MNTILRENANEIISRAIDAALPDNAVRSALKSLDIPAFLKGTDFHDQSADF